MTIDEAANAIADILAEMPCDGAELIDVTETAYDAGFACKVYLTQDVWDKCVEWTEADSERQDYQDQDARLWDVLFVSAAKMQMGFDPVAGLSYQIHCLVRDGRSTEAMKIKLQIVPKGDDGLLIGYDGCING